LPGGGGLSRPRAQIVGCGLTVYPCSQIVGCGLTVYPCSQIVGCGPAHALYFSAYEGAKRVFVGERTGHQVTG
jgi:hypothetical protein